MAVTIPVMAKARIGHFAEAQALKVLGIHSPTPRSAAGAPPGPRHPPGVAVLPRR
jgi:hypothetical protein